MKKTASTRHLLLQTAFELIYVKGYQATSIDEIVAAAQLTKGAFFHHFANKADMGLALITEYMHDTIRTAMLDPILTDDGDCLGQILYLMRHLLLETPALQARHGCPHHNLIQEMAPIDPRFKDGLLAMTETVRAQLVALLAKAQQKGQIRQVVDIEQVVLFIFIGYAGVRNIGKLYDSPDYYEAYLALLADYFERLR